MVDATVATATATRPAEGETAPADPGPTRRRRRRLALVAAFVVAAGAGGGVGAYLGLHRTVSISDLMGLSPTTGRPAPNFTLVDQANRPVSLSGLKGKVVVLNFFDDRCTDLCPVISSELKDADRRLGPAAKDVAFVAINVNSAHSAVRWVRLFSQQQGLGALSHWYFVTGSTPALEQAWKSYQVSVQVGAGGAVYHSSPMYFIDRAGRERAVAAPYAYTRANGSGYLPGGQMQEWGQGIASEVRTLLKGGSGTAS